MCVAPSTSSTDAVEPTARNASARRVLCFGGTARSAVPCTRRNGGAPAPHMTAQGLPRQPGQVDRRVPRRSVRPLGWTRFYRSDRQPRRCLPTARRDPTACTNTLQRRPVCRPRMRVWRRVVRRLTIPRPRFAKSRAPSQLHVRVRSSPQRGRRPAGLGNEPRRSAGNRYSRWPGQAQQPARRTNATVQRRYRVRRGDCLLAIRLRAGRDTASASAQPASRGRARAGGTRACSRRRCHA